jgi:D-serine deaminase-like pyridoxal phosphate-dependent protein
MKPLLNFTELDTPALILDLDSVNHNLRTMAEFFATRAAKLRPHFKSHQVLPFAIRQVDAGATGITCARLDHAEVLVEQGILSVLIANEIVGEKMLRQFVELSRRAPVVVAVDDSRIVADLARIGGKRVSELNVVVDLNVGLGRCGVEPGEAALSLVKEVVGKGLRFRGLMGYAGGIRLQPGPQKQRAVQSFVDPLLATKALIQNAGIAVETLTCGGTGDYSISGSWPGITEIQAGSYLLMDTSYAPFVAEFRPALSVLTTVISKPASERLVVDAGLRAISSERGLPTLRALPRASVRALHAEHALIELSANTAGIRVGDKLELWVHYLDATLHLHRCLYGVKNGVVAEIFTIEQ